MAEYKDLRGGKVKNYTTNPDNPYDGQVWFNETAGELRIRKGTKTSAWASGGNMNTARQYLASASNGTPTATLSFGGSVSPNQQTESYNGSSWTEVNDLNIGRGALAGAGIQTAALAIGSGSPDNANTESWNGTNWTEVNNLNTGRNALGGQGTQTAAIAFGGNSPYRAETEIWN